MVEERWPLVHATILLYFPFPLKRISLWRTTAFSWPAASSWLLFLPLCLSFAHGSALPCSLFSISPFIAFYVISYLSGTRHKYIFAQQNGGFKFYALCTPRTYSSYIGSSKLLVKKIKCNFLHACNNIICIIICARHAKTVDWT